MSTKKTDSELRAANPVPKQTLEALDLVAGEAALGEAIVAEAQIDEPTAPPPSRSRPRRPVLVLLAGGLAVLATIAVVLLAAGGASESPPAYGAELVRFAESTPLLLLEGPGWRVEDVYEAGHSPYLPRGSGGEGSMEFVNGKPIPDETTRILPNGTVRGMAPPSVRQRKVELSWHNGELGFGGNPVTHPIRLPVLGTTAQVNTRAGRMIITTRAGRRVIETGGPGDREMAAVWREDGHVLELRAAVPDLAAFEERLGWLTRVDSQTWLDAMPAKVVKAADHDATVREMLKGIPVPAGFDPGMIPNEGLTTNRYQVGADVTSTVACLWFRQWGEARRSGDRKAELEAERAMATSKHWAILREMAKEGAYPETVWKLAAEMPSGVRHYAKYTWRLLPQAEALGCARRGIPVLPWKQRLQRERRERDSQ
jgi:hypothetical protein